MAYERTRVNARNPEKGVYRTLDGQFEIRAADKPGHWSVFRLVEGGAQQVAANVKGYDRALDRNLEEPEVTLEALNTPPAKPTKPELAERFAAEDASRAEPDPATERKRRRQRRQPATA